MTKELRKDDCFDGDDNNALEDQPYSPAITQETKTQAIRQALNGQKALMIRTPNRVDIADVDAVEKAAQRYVQDCSAAGILPNVEGLCCALGLSRQWFYQFLREKPNSPSTAYLNRLRMAWTSLRIGLAERQILSAPTTIFLLKNSGLGFSDNPVGNDDSQTENRPAWAVGLSDDAYMDRLRERIDALVCSLPEDHQNAEGGEAP